MSPLMKPARLALPAKAHPWQITPDQFFTACQSVRSDSFPLSRVYLGRISSVRLIPKLHKNGKLRLPKQPR